MGPIATILGSGVISAIVAGVFSYCGEKEKAQEDANRALFDRHQALELEERRFSYDVLKQIWSIDDPTKQKHFALLAIAMARIFPNDVLETLKFLTAVGDESSHGRSQSNEGYNASDLDGQNTRLIVETKTGLTKESKIFNPLCELAFDGFNCYGEGPTWTPTRPKGVEPFMFYSSDSRSIAFKLQNYLLERLNPNWSFKPELADTLPPKTIYIYYPE